MPGIPAAYERICTFCDMSTKYHEIKYRSVLFVRSKTKNYSYKPSNFVNIAI